MTRRVASQFFFFFFFFFVVSPRDHFICPVPSFFRNERNWMKKSARRFRKTGKPELTWLTGSYAPDD